MVISTIYTISFGRYKANPTSCLILLTLQKYWYFVVVSEKSGIFHYIKKLPTLCERREGCRFCLFQTDCDRSILMYVTEKECRKQRQKMCLYMRSPIKGRDHASSSQYKSSLSPPHKLTIYNSDYFPWLYYRHHRKLGT